MGRVCLLSMFAVQSTTKEELTELRMSVAWHYVERIRGADRRRLGYHIVHLQTRNGVASTESDILAQSEVQRCGGGR